MTAATILQKWHEVVSAALDVDTAVSPVVETFLTTEVRPIAVTEYRGLFLFADGSVFDSVGEEAFASAEDAGMPTTANEQRHERAKYEAYRSERQKGASDENARKQEVAAEKQLFD